MLIKSLFDPSKDILRHHREKVITYGAAADRREVRLRAEIAETIVTDSMEAQFEELRTNNSFKPVGEAVPAFCPFLPNKTPKTCARSLCATRKSGTMACVVTSQGRELRAGRCPPSNRLQWP